MTNQRTRPLSLRNEGARHPFRLTLPVEPMLEAREEIRVQAQAQRKSVWRNEDVHLFLLSFLAFFTAFYLFIF